MVLIVSLPANDPSLARAAGEVDAIKVHINVKHAASGVTFGTFADEKDNIEKIIASVSIPVGIMPGADRTATVDEMDELHKMGVSFFDIYEYDMPDEYWGLEGVEKMLAIGEASAENAVERLKGRGVWLLEASFVPHEQYGARLTMGDLVKYSDLVEHFGGAVVVPTQKNILPQEVRMLHSAGVRGLMIGKIVTGDTAISIREATTRFRKAIQGL
ncbi:MAG: hypothetical protein AB1546_04350 [bacterium]